MSTTKSRSSWLLWLSLPHSKSLRPVLLLLQTLVSQCLLSVSTAPPHSMRCTLAAQPRLARALKDSSITHESMS